MELVLTTQDLESLPEPRVFVKLPRPEGLLNSNYKNLVKNNFKNTTSNSLFSIKQRLRSRQYQFTSSIGTALKVSLFFIAILLIFN
jgi:hypothetical protein